MSLPPLRASEHLHGVKYEIRGALARRADQLEKEGHDIIKLNIGNPGLFGFRMPGSMRVAIVENLHQADPYSHQKGIFPAREAVVMLLAIGCLAEQFTVAHSPRRPLSEVLRNLENTA